MADYPILKQPTDYYGRLGDTGYFTIVRADNGGSPTLRWQYSIDGGVSWNNSPATGNATPTLLLPITEDRLTYLYRCRITATGYDTTYSNVVKLVLEQNSLLVTLQTNQSETIHLDKTLVDVATLPCYLRDSCSIKDPVLLIEAELHDLLAVNYATIPQFGRSYFAEPPTSVRTGLVELRLHCDVISSFKGEIRANYGIVRRAENDVWNLMINDGSMVSYQDPYILTKPFPYGFAGHCFILAVAGA